MRRARSVESAQRGRACWLQSGRVDGGIPATLSLTDAPPSQSRCAAWCAVSSKNANYAWPSTTMVTLSVGVGTAGASHLLSRSLRYPLTATSNRQRRDALDSRSSVVIGFSKDLSGRREQRLSQPGERTHADHTNDVISDARRSPPSWYQGGGAGPPQFGGWRRPRRPRAVLLNVV
jgi:hypothetical protein